VNNHVAQPALSKAVPALFTSSTTIFASLLPRRVEAILLLITVPMDNIKSRLRGVGAFMGLGLALSSRLEAGPGRR
jgi:hypothetical protein